MCATHPIIKEYKNKNLTDRLYVQYPGLRQVFDHIENDEIDTEFESLSNSERCQMTPQAVLLYRFSDLLNFIKSIFGNNLSTKH